MPHPLSPLDAAEIAAAAQAALAAVPGARVVSAGPREPAKAAYLAWRDGDGARPDREALVVLAAGGGGRGVVVALPGGAPRDRRTIAGARPPITPEDYAGAAA